MIHVIAAITLHPGRRGEFLAEFHKIVPAVRAEDGCLEYGPAVDAVTDLAEQAPARPDVVTVVEKWESVGHLKRHLAAPHLKAFWPKVNDMMAGANIVILDPA